ncbi:ATP-dependent zinc metalloprotease FtsH [Marinobacterium nitratireducens]|uniref:ATP-dependent zinc metalloprotease FtsH n=1 Tax=Marinobacterium nitratireducens TaxID=518897 RepID=A0A917ZKH6_9GAMM|nr:ATP-dependent zinc metalloprotease FtsH [Marinobacterium nitratireducens]GGO83492.1 ATP-dependent zinc metalloprotease FtsH [Marinobacterium nitratireducens]
MTDPQPPQRPQNQQSPQNQQGPGGAPPQMSMLRMLVWFCAVMLFTYYWLDLSQGQQQELSYSQFKARVSADQVESVTMQGDRVVGQLRSAIEGSPSGDGQSPRNRFVTTLPPVDDPELIPLLEQHEVEVRARSAEGTWWARLLIGVLPWFLLIGLFWYASVKMQEKMMGGGGAGGLFGFAKSRAKRFSKGQSKITFDDVAGLENAKRDLEEISDYLRDPGHFRKLGAKIPRGILLMGPPGTGKTLLARAVAGEAEVPFFSISGSEFIEMFVGVGASRVRDLFENAKKEAPAIIFVDEIDSVGRARGTGLGGGHDEREQTLNQILNEMDGFEPHETVVVLAATNRPDVLDAALMRPGRFDRKVTLDLPDRRARLSILKIHSREVPLAQDVDLERIAALTVGFSGADLENLINEAALLAGRSGADQVDMDCVLKSRDKVVLGGVREMALTEDEKQLVAYHESGHALVASLLPHADPLDKVTIIPRGQALGMTEQIPEEERHNLRQSYLRDRIAVMLGGRASEQLIFGEVSSGAAEDLKQATHLARHMISQWGMSDKIGPVAFRRGEEHIFLGREMAQQRDFSEHTAEVIDDEVSHLLREIGEQVAKLLSDNRDRLEALAQALLQKETLQADEIRAILDTAKSAAL